MNIGRSSTLKSPKYIQKRKKRRLITTLISVLVSMIVILSFVILINVPFLKIKNIEISGISSLEKESIEKVVKDKISGKYLYIIPKSNFLFYPKREIIDSILVNNSKVNNLKVGIRGLSLLEIKIIERIPEVIVCDGFKENEDDNICYFADNTGYVFEKISKISSTTDNYFKYYLNSTVNPITIGHTFIDQIKFADFQKFNTEIKNSGIVSTGILMNEDGNYELYIKNLDQSIAVVYFDQREGLEKILSNFLIFWKNAKDKKIGLESMPDFDYIDLRFGNNVFYLIKDNGGSSTK